MGDTNLASWLALSSLQADGVEQELTGRIVFLSLKADGACRDSPQLGPLPLVYVALTFAGEDRLSRPGQGVSHRLLYQPTALSKCIRRLTNPVAFLKSDGGCMHLILHRSRYPLYHILLPQRRSNPSNQPTPIHHFFETASELRNDVRGAAHARMPTRACPRPCGWMRSVSSLRRYGSYARCTIMTSKCVWRVWAFGGPILRRCAARCLPSALPTTT
ncbi:hypothetical protein HMN09_00133900 [Mycena chlorophos]|uniref:Uncharacterized protein n=1 Tax=Mycena chlorophos TaxID=658473 RepID=A0A8H6TKI1_MYCCL|nr:hypothetical protein HMN09_00133900 [Mycena chlorophos]